MALEPQSSSTPETQALGTAAFYDVDGTLISTNVVHAYAYYALNTRTIKGRVSKTASLLASLPAYWLADKYDRRFFNEHFYRNYAGFSEDRLVILGQECFDKVIRPAIFKGAPQLIARSKAQGHRQVLVTGALEYIVEPLARYLGVDDWVANRLELQDLTATGRLEQPFIGGANKAAWIRRYAEEHHLDLERSFAYADSASDLPMLSVVGQPCAVNPDFKMRTTARAYQWAVLDFERG